MEPLQATMDMAGYQNGNQQLIELRKVAKSYKTAVGDFVALKQIDLTVDAGEFVAVIGKSGSGKSTLVNMLTGIDRPTSGEVLIGDTAVHLLKEGQIAQWRGRTIGIVFQFFQLLPPSPLQRMSCCRWISATCIPAKNVQNGLCIC